MGINAQTLVPKFTAGDTLTAANTNLLSNGIAVFADTTTRDAAFGGTGEKTLAQGQYAYIEATGTLQVYTGSAWVTTGGGLQYITGASFTTATSFSLPASTFTTTYRNYRIIVNITAITSDASFTMRVRSSGTDFTSAVYGSMFVGLTSTGSATNSAGNDQTSWLVGDMDSGIPAYSLVLDVMSPQVATYTTAEGSYSAVVTAGTSAIARSGGLLLNNTGQYDSLSFISSVASSMTGVYRVYGYRES